MTPAPKVYILKHIPNEDAGTILDFLVKKNIPYQKVNLHENEALPEDLSAIRALVILGGPMNVYEESKFRFLVRENEFLARAIAHGVPCLGVCLGAQLIVKALGSKVYKAAAKEVGWDDIVLTEAAKKDPLFSCMTFPSMRVLQWHEDTFDLPKDAVLLAGSRQVPHQAFRIGKNSYGLQFHVEVNRPTLEDWFKKSPDLPKILSEYDAYQPVLERISRAMFEEFFQ